MWHEFLFPCININFWSKIHSKLGDSNGGKFNSLSAESLWKIWFWDSRLGFHRYSLLNFKTVGSKLDYIRYFNFIKWWGWLICQKVSQIQILPDVVKLQNKGFEIKSTVPLMDYLLNTFYCYSKLWSGAYYRFEDSWESADAQSSKSI